MNNFSENPKLLIGKVIEVAGANIKVELTYTLSELSISYGGNVYLIGQIGSIIKIHAGRKTIFGFVSLLRMDTDDTGNEDFSRNSDAESRLMEVELFAEGEWTGKNLKFTRGIKTYPLPRQNVYILTKDEQDELFRSAEGVLKIEPNTPLVEIGSYSGSVYTKCHANIDKMFGLHSAILGSTGSGKSGTVAAILHSILDHKVGDSFLNPNIVLIDVHGEYPKAFNGRCVHYRAYDALNNETVNGEELKLPYWLLSFEEFRSLVIGKTEYEATSQSNSVHKALLHARLVSKGLKKPAPTQYEVSCTNETLEEFCSPEDETKASSFDIDKPTPFCLNEFENYIKYVLGSKIKDKKSISLSPTDFAKDKSILDKLKVLRNDARLRFIMDNWQKDDIKLDSILAKFFTTSESKGLKIIDISGLPNEVAGILTAVIARLLFQIKLFQTSEERVKSPLLLICEEAHRYVPNSGEAQYSSAQAAIRRIAREGRKFGIGLMLVSQRPSDLEGTVMAQCGTWIILRLTNSSDQNHVAKFLPDGLAGIVKSLPNMQQQEAIFVGDGAAIPSKIKIRTLKSDQLPQSQTTKFMDGWTKDPLEVKDFKIIAERMSGD